jgi:hypothetical protein
MPSRSTRTRIIPSASESAQSSSKVLTLRYAERLHIRGSSCLLGTGFVVQLVQWRGYGLDNASWCNLVSSESSHRSCCPHCLIFSGYMMLCPCGLSRPGHEANHLSLSGSKFKNKWSSNSTPMFFFTKCTKTTFNLLCNCSAFFKTTAIAFGTPLYSLSP